MTLYPRYIVYYPVLNTFFRLPCIIQDYYIPGGLLWARHKQYKVMRIIYHTYRVLGTEMCVLKLCLLLISTTTILLPLVVGPSCVVAPSLLQRGETLMALFPPSLQVLPF